MKLKFHAAMALVIVSIFSGLSPAISDDLIPLDQETGSASNEYSGVGDNIGQRLGQTITPSISGYLKSVEIYVSKDNDNVTGNLNVDVIPMSSRGVVLEGKQLTSERVDASLIFTYGSWVTVTFSEPASLPAGKPFMIRLVGDNYGQPRENTYRWYSRLAPTAEYLGGQPYVNQDGTWAAQYYDLLLRTYVEAGVGPVVETVVLPKLSIYLKANVKTPSVIDVKALRKVVGNLGAGKTLVCTAYSYGTSKAANAYSLKLAKSVCARAKALKTNIIIEAETLADRVAPKAAKGSVWTSGSYRVDVSLKETVG